ncbi:vitamin B12-dependent ribonucleotide reductase [Proteiniclasticum sp.]|uniref:vitamin B12-dependent ribonucleotide reductase n=1 Tax=Proteiniclasticum sp. TaxID=2053595 RepID=UPI002898D1B2|nr:vitamin B12-dependent ribonucleotide reductase [Proteiniclasticum sp.]
MKDIKDLFKRYYTKELDNNKDKTVYDLFDWSKRDVLLKNHKNGKIIVEMKDLEFPTHYSQNAVDIIASKYFRKAGVNNEQGYESSMKMVAHRMVSFWMESLADEGIITTQDQKDIFYDEMVYGLLNQMYAPNSPQWFNTGLKQSYGIEGGQNDLFYYDPVERKVVKSKDTYTRTQASACFILSVEDKLLGDHSISEQYVTETKLFKGGSGTGTNFSSIRAVGERLTGGGVSSGLMSFLKGLDRNAGAIKSGGTTRRAAKMVCLDIDHPEIEQFILWKAKEEDKVRALAKMGYDADIDGEAYETVSGQNSNNSLRISDEFMRKVKNIENDPEATITLQGRVDNSVNREIKVSTLWEEFNDAACKSADPAPQFTDTFNAWHTCPAGEDGDLWAKHNRLNSTNPCGEYAFLDDTSCNLASLNIYRFYDVEKNLLDVKGLKHMIGLNQLLLESSIHWGQFPTVDIARKTYMFRTTGLGIANSASLLMALGIPYDSDEARNLSAALMGLITGESYRVSALMAKAVGPFEKYELNKPYMNRVIRNHARVAGALDSELEELHYEPMRVNHGLLFELGHKELSDTLKTAWSEAVDLGELNGYRNAQVSVIAPTGTISFAMDCAATSIEPFFSHITYKKLVGGGFMTIANPIVEVALKNLGYSRDEVRDIMAYIGKEENGMVLDGKIEGAPHLKEEHYPIFDTANVCGTGKRFIQHYGHVLMVAALTPLVSGAISKTVNLPKDATVEDFKEVHIRSWETGVKGISLYRDGSKFAQPLNTKIDYKDENLELESLTYDALLDFAKEAKKELPKVSSGANRREKMAGIRAGHTHPAQIDDVKVYITVNRNERGEISEIYMTTDREGTLITGLLNSLSKTISVMLQYHIPPKDISKMLRGQKYEPYGFVSKHPYIKNVSSISDLISKVIDIELGDYSRVQIKPEENDVLTKSRSRFVNNYFEPENIKQLSMVVDESDVKTVIKDAEKNGEKLYDSVCSTCQSTRMVKNGTCKVCLDCGTTTGCS